MIKTKMETVRIWGRDGISHWHIYIGCSSESHFMQSQMKDVFGVYLTDYEIISIHRDREKDIYIFEVKPVPECLRKIEYIGLEYRVL